MGARLLRFPVGYIDEHFYSLYARYHLDTGGTNAIETLSELTGGEVLSPFGMQGATLKRIFARLPQNAYRDVYELIEKHTLYPYYVIVDGHTRVGVTSFHIGFAHYWSMVMPYIGSLRVSTNKLFRRLRFCPQCALDDIANYGQPYWHRSHQLPGVLACYRHGLILVTFCPVCGASCGHKSILSLPSLRCVNGHSLVDATLLASIKAPVFLEQSARIAHDLLNGGYSVPTYLRKTRAYGDALARVGMLSRADARKNWREKIDPDSLYEAVVDYWEIPGHLLEGRRGGQYRWISLRNGLHDAVMRLNVTPDTAFPLLLLIGFLFGNAETYARHVNPSKQKRNQTEISTHAA